MADITKGTICMVDIESYDNIATAAIASIGAVRFSIETREIFNEFYVTVDPKTCKEAGLSFGADTIAWWQKQSVEARQALRLNNIPLQQALDEFSGFVSAKEALLCWGMFDAPVIEHALRKLGVPVPWKYWNTVDCRTIADLLGAKIDRNTGTHHNALQDAKVQAKFMIDLLTPKE